MKLTVQIQYDAVPTIDQLALAITSNRAGIHKPAYEYTREDVLANFREACRYAGQYFPNMTRLDLVDSTTPGEEERAVVLRLFPELEADLFCYTETEEYSPLIASLARVLYSGVANDVVRQRLRELEPGVANSWLDDAAERARRFAVADVVARVLMPALLEQQEYKSTVQALVDLAPIRDEAAVERAAVTLLTELVHFIDFYPGEQDLCRALNYALASVQNTVNDCVDDDDLGELAGLFLRLALKLQPDLTDAVLQLLERLLDGDTEEEAVTDGQESWTVPQTGELPLAS